MNERDIFFAAIDIIDPAHRSAFVARACGPDDALRGNVEALLKTHSQTGQFLESSPVGRDSIAQTLLSNPSETMDEPVTERASGEAEFRKYLRPATRAGWLGRLTHYEIEAILGRGAFGIVGKAFDEKLHRVVAIKLMNPDLASTSPPRRRFLREARTAAAVTHENIVSIHAVEEDPIPYLVMEYVSGQTLQQRLDAKGPLEVREVLRLGQQIAAGLAAAHAANLIHRDIKPSNILLMDGPNERLKISDFGLARAVDDASMTSSGLIAGTPLYMSPEQARGEALDHRSDLFSLGSVLYQMAGGRPPFRAAGTVAVLKRVCEDTPRSLRDVISGTPDWLETIIFKLLEKKPEERYQTAQEVADLLARCLKELELNGKVSCVQGRSGTAGAQILQSSESATAGATKGRFRWLAGGLLAAGGVLALFAANPWAVPSPGSLSEAVIASRNGEPTSDAGGRTIPPEGAGLREHAADSPKLAVAPFSSEQAKAFQEAWAKSLSVPVEYQSSTGMKFRLVPPGEFLMGAPDSDTDAQPAEKPQHLVRLTQPFYIGTTEVTVGQFAKFVEATGSKTEAESDGEGAFDIRPRVRRPTLVWNSMSGRADPATDPVRCVSWRDAGRFCEWLGKTESRTCRLPTEAEWEYACRAGTQTRYSFGDGVAETGSPPRGDGAPLSAVGRLPPNPFGLYDMHGNLNEICWDSGRTYTAHPVVDPLGNLDPQTPAVVRGGAVSANVIRMRSSHRYLNDQRQFPGDNFATPVKGFRVVLLPKSSAPASK